MDKPDCPRYYEVQEALSVSFTEAYNKYNDTEYSGCLTCSGDCDKRKSLDMKLWRSDEVEVVSL